MSSGPKQEAIPVAEMLRFPEGYQRATKTPAWATVQARLV